MSDEVSRPASDPRDALLDRAVDALRDASPLEGPSPELIARTQSAVREARARDLRAGRLRPFHRALRIAAAVALVASAVGAYLVATRDRGTVVSPITQPSPVTPPNPGGAVVRNDDVRPIPGVAPKPVDPTRPDMMPDAVARGSEGSTPFVESNTNPVAAAAVVASPLGIAGTVLFVGPPPQPTRIDMSAVKECRDRHPQGALDDSVLVSNGGLANVVVSIEPTVGQDLPEMASASAYEERAPLVLDQHDCQFRPRILAGMVGQELVVRNSDPFLHNVHSKADLNPRFNIGQPTVEFGRRLDALAAPERFQIKCDIHPWMTAAVSVFEHPYFAVTAADGSFTIPTGGLADGTYTLLAWHETLGMRRAQVEVHAGHAVTMTDFHFAPVNAAAVPERTATMQACANCEK
jgi:hypothetical protein